DLHLAECSQQRPRAVAVAVTGNTRRLLPITGRPLGPAGIAGALEHLVELRLQHGFQQFKESSPEAHLNSIQPIFRKDGPQFRFPTAAGQASCYGLSWRNLRRLAPESLVASSWRLRRLQFPTTPATAPSITSSARCWKNNGTSMPSALAVLRFSNITY